jgi:hypothetical protein
MGKKRLSKLGFKALTAYRSHISQPNPPTISKGDVKMKRKPLEKAEFIGCGTCGTIPRLALTDEKKFYPMYPHYLEINIDSNHFQVERDEITTISDIEREFKILLDNCQFAELFHETPLHDETYELNKDDGKWYLVAQGQGYA